MPRRYFSYVRVSTARQGQTGTSLVEQRAAIQRHAQRMGLTITKEFEEQETASKRGRPVFSEMLKALRQGKADGVIIHKIDRSARNLKDWAELGELIDAGLEVQFANENLDLYSRGGRLSADIQAVVAADYIRNLREEVKKGFYGRIKQGLFPMPAPIGYLNRGQGNPKEPDPVQSLLVRKAFELYVTRKYSLHALEHEMYRLGFRSTKGGRVSKKRLGDVLRNHFYIGVIRLKTTDELFIGRHMPVVPKKLFDRVQEVLDGKSIHAKKSHCMLFSRLLSCSSCAKRLIGEKQKGIIYYRCQTKSCPQKTIREDTVEGIFRTMLKSLRFTDVEMLAIRPQLKETWQTESNAREVKLQTLHLLLEQNSNKLSKLTDALIDGTLDREIYTQKKNELVLKEQGIKQKLSEVGEREEYIVKRIESFLDLAHNAEATYNVATLSEKRELIEIATSNLAVEDKTLIVKLNYPFQLVAERSRVSGGGPIRSTPRTVFALLRQLHEHFRGNEGVGQAGKTSQGFTSSPIVRTVSGQFKPATCPSGFVNSPSL